MPASQTQSAARQLAGTYAIPSGNLPSSFTGLPVRPRLGGDRGADPDADDDDDLGSETLNLLIQLWRRTSNRPCPPNCPGHFCGSPAHGPLSRLISCAELLPDGRCESCAVEELATSITDNKRPSRSAVDIKDRDGEKAVKWCGEDERTRPLPDGLVQPVMRGERVKLDTNYVSLPTSRAALDH